VRQEQLELARAQRYTEWYGIWDEDFRREYVRAMSGETSAEDALATTAERWNELKEQHTG
jgi:ABC-type glycerol-3-phosphate transport system substrate-binding protein